MEKLLNEKEAAEILGLSVHWMRRARWEGTGPEFIKLNGQTIRYKPSVLEEYINSRIAKSTSDAMGLPDASRIKTESLAKNIECARKCRKS